MFFIIKHPKVSVSLNESSFIADNKGHLLPGIVRSERSPFGEFIGTWDLPKTIPGPYHVHPMGRTEKNFSSLCAQRDQTIREMEMARAYKVTLMNKSLFCLSLVYFHFRKKNQLFRKFH